MSVINKIQIVISFLLLSVTTSVAFAADQQVGRFVQLRGTATIERGKSQITAKLKDGLLASDTVTTAAASRAKLLFIDDSVLTLSDNSKLVVKEFIYSKGEQGKSVFNLLDGKMRSVVGKTKFEVHTPTAVAAARGTVIYFDVGRVNNQNYSRIICLEGNVQIRNIVSTVTGQVTLTPGTMVVVKVNEPPPPPVPVPPAMLNQIMNNGGSGGDGSSGNGSSGGSSSGGSGSGSSGGSGSDGSGSGGSSGSNSSPPAMTITPLQPVTPPIQQQPIVQPRKVNINIGLP